MDDDKAMDATVVADLYKIDGSMRSALTSINESQRAGKDISSDAWSTLYKGLIRAGEIDPNIAAEASLRILSQIDPATPNYAVVENLFHENVVALERGGKTDQAVSHLEHALTGQQFGGKRKNTPSELPKTLPPKPDASRLAADGQVSKELVQRPSDNVQAAAMGADNPQSKDPSDGRKKTPPREFLTYNMPQHFKDSIAMEYLRELDVLAKNNVAKAADSVVSVITASPGNPVPLEDDMWGAFNKYVGVWLMGRRRTSRKISQQRPVT